MFYDTNKFKKKQKEEFYLKKWLKKDYFKTLKTIIDKKRNEMMFQMKMLRK